MIEIIEEIARAKGNQKMVIMTEYPELEEVLLLAYNPFKKYYITPGEIDFSGIENEGFPVVSRSTIGICKEGIDLLNRLSSRDLSGNAAFEAVCDYVVGLTPGSAELFKRVLDKDLRMGCGIKTINKVFPGLIPTTDQESGMESKPSFMLCKTFDPDKAVYPLLAAIKKDGTRARAIDSILITRAGHRIDGMSHIEMELDLYDFEKDGELTVPGTDFDSGSGLVRNDNETPEAVFHLFDCPSAPGNKLERYQFLLKNVVQTDHLKIIKHWIIKTPEQLKDFYNFALSKGEEGIVIYTIDHEYRDVRSMDWTRLVPIKKADCKVTGFKEGNGKLKGQLGKITIDFDGIKVDVGTGFPEKAFELLTKGQKKKALETYSTEENYNHLLRSYIWKNQGFFLGKIAEVHYKEKTKTGSMRQPRFKGWRFDKKEPNFE